MTDVNFKSVLPSLMPAVCSIQRAAPLISAIITSEISHSSYLHPQTGLMLLLALAIAPGLAICLYIFFHDKHDPEPASNLIMSFVLGMLSTIPAIILELMANQFKTLTVTGILMNTFFIALAEEFSKFLPLRYYSMYRKSFDEPLDGIVYSVMISMGFATVENLVYVFADEQGNGL
ncbi:MAG TPA: PrsW family glutamic-type intramembrane protease, partial [Chitinophagaceae bacterium]|nr:PrsW family glutamic-type intramembrane protease [Chitinophagaceae bacterium]